MGDAADHVADRAVQRGGAMIPWVVRKRPTSLIAYEPVHGPSLVWIMMIPVRQGERRRVR